MTVELTGHGAVPHSTRVRRAVTGDCSTLAALHGEAVAERLTHRGGEVLVGPLLKETDITSAEESFMALIGDGSTEVLIAELVADAAAPSDAAVAVGHAVVRMPGSAPLAPEVAVIEELYVTPGARRVGVGSILLERTKAMATQRGCSGLDAVALPGDRATKNFFEDHAMVARAIVVHAELGTGRGAGRGAEAGGS